MARVSKAKRVLTDFDLSLADDAARFFYNPTGYTRYAYPWGEADSPLAKYPGPDNWQVEVMDYIGKALQTSDKAVRVAISSGHGSGKSALFSFLISWFMATRPDANIKATANTKT